MPQLIKRFTTKDLLTHNNSVCNPSILIDEGIMSYRDGRDEKKDDNSKLLKIATIDRNLNTGNCYTISIPGKDLSDPRLLKWKDNIYVVITQIILRMAENKSYLARMDLLDLRTEALLGLTYDAAEEKEKNWIFFEYNNQLLCSRSLNKGLHHILRLDGNKIYDYATSHYQTRWSPNLGDVRNTSNFAYHDGLMWGCIHSHDEHLHTPATYYCGFFAFELDFPFKVMKMSNVPLFYPRYRGDILYPNHLDIVGDSFRIGVGVKDLDHFDIITISKDEIMNHMNNNITYNYVG
jgi:hypothetical protein